MVFSRGEGSNAAGGSEITEPLLGSGSSRLNDAPAPGMYSSEATSTTPIHASFKRFLRSALGIYSYKDPQLMNKPRKIPMRVEPKTFLALERTFLNWISMSVTLATLGTTLLGLSVSNTQAVEPQEDGTDMTPKGLQLLACILLPVGMLVMVYAIFVYNARVTALRQKEMRFFEDRFSPVIVTLLVVGGLVTLWLMRLMNFIQKFYS